MLADANWDQEQWGVITSGPAVINDRGPGTVRAGQVSARNVEFHIDPDLGAKLRPASALIAALNGIWH